MHPDFVRHMALSLSSHATVRAVPTETLHFKHPPYLLACILASAPSPTCPTHHQTPFTPACLCVALPVPSPARPLLPSPVAWNPTPRPPLNLFPLEHPPPSSLEGKEAQGNTQGVNENLLGIQPELILEPLQVSLAKQLHGKLHACNLCHPYPRLTFASHLHPALL